MIEGANRLVLSKKFGGPAQRVVYAGPDQSMLNRGKRSEWLT
jgi:hypothetical protein